MLRFEDDGKGQEAVQKAKEIAAAMKTNRSSLFICSLRWSINQTAWCPPLLARLGIRTDIAITDVEREIGRLPRVTGFGQQHMGKALQ